MKVLIAIVFITAILSVPGRTHAQVHSLSAGDLVRITIRDDTSTGQTRPVTYVSKVVDASTDSISISWDARTLTFANASIRCLEQQVKRSNADIGALLGLGLGLIAGGTLALIERNCTGPCTLNLFGDDEEEHTTGHRCFFGSPDKAFLTGFTTVGLPAAFIGWIAGAASPTYRWVEVPVGSTAFLRTGFGSLGPALTLTF